MTGDGSGAVRGAAGAGVYVVFTVKRVIGYVSRCGAGVAACARRLYLCRAGVVT